MNIINFPLKYVLTDYSMKLVPKTKFLIFTCEIIKFECYNESGLFNNFQINFSDILRFRYAESTCLLNVTLTDFAYTNLFGNTSNRTIWFFLDFEDLFYYQTLLYKVIQLNNLKLRSEPILPKLLNSFFEEVLKIKSSPNFVQWDNLLDSNVKGQEVNNILSDISNTVILKEKNNLKANETQGRKRKLNSLERKFEYSPSHTHSIEIEFSDLQCIRNRKCLNDNIINLHIMYVYYNILTEEQRQKTHVFSSFFNTKLVGNECSKKIDTSESRHKRVAKWTKNVDIFDKDFLIIPVCEKGHWFLVVICFPWMVGMISYEKNVNSECKVKVPENYSEFAKKVRLEKVSFIKKDGIDPKPCILIFDSLALYTRPEKVNIIREYLQAEWDTKRAIKDGPLLFDKTTIRGYLPSIFQQLNTKDCGIYLLHHFESFFTSPIPSYSYEFFKSHIAPWFEPEDADQKRQKIYKELLKIVKKVKCH